MMKSMACLLVVLMSGCPDIKVDPDEVAGPTVEFDPARTLESGARFIPFPNDLARDPATGKINLGPQNCESPAAQATRENVLNQLDGFGTYETAMQVTFTEDVDEASLADHILMYQLTSEGTPIMPSPSTQPIPVQVVSVAKTPRFATADCNAPEMVEAVTFVPRVPLEQKSTYFVVLTKGITTTSGEPFDPAFTWAIVTSQEPPVTLDEQGNIVSDRTPIDPSSEEGRAQLIALANLWELHQPGLRFVQAASGTQPQDVLVGFQFTTQTVIDPLDPAIAGSPAAELGAGGVLQPHSVTDRFGELGMLLCGAEATADPAQCFLKLALGGCSPLTTGCGANNYEAGTDACQLLNCAAVGDVIGGGVVTTTYQTQVPNMLEGGADVPGAWTDPVHPEPQGQLTLETLVIVPKGTPPATGWPTVVFGHGLSSSKESVFAIGGRLAQFGFATVAIDTVAHGSRAVRISRDINLGCIGRCFSGTTPTQTECETIADCQQGETCGSATAMPGLLPPSPTSAPQCYAPFLSPDLAATRDGIRQTVLDHQRVVKALAACGPDGCSPISVDPSRIFYAGMSLGAIIGTTSTAMAPEIEAAVLNAGGVGWVDILENTETLAIRCQLVNGLIDAGILEGDKWTGGTEGLCTTDAWKEQPGYAMFAAIARWILDPADPANFAQRLAVKPVLIQEIVGDTVVPNIATDNQAALVGLAAMAQAADPFDPGSPAPSAAITEMPTASKFVKYADDATAAYVHSSLLRPAPTADPRIGANGTLRLQIDAATFLFNNQ